MEKNNKTTTNAISTNIVHLDNDTTIALNFQTKQQQLKINADGVPDMLKKLPNWLLWKLEIKPDGKSTKIPYTIKDGKLIKADATNISDSCMTFNKALEIANKFKCSGVGFAFDGKGIVGIDIDHCIINGKINDEATKLIEKFKDTYIECSQSNEGLHIFIFDNNIANGERLKKHRKKGFEIYEISHYFAMLKVQAIA